MKNLWLFFPQNDLALASGQARFTAPKAAVALQRSGMALPLWMCSPGDCIISNGVNDEWLSRIQREFNVEGDVWDHNPDGFLPRPWGWSAASAFVFAQNGFPPELLPTAARLEELRQLSHRRTVAEVARNVDANSRLNLYPPATETSDSSEIAATASRNGCVVVKSPWSSSGRGVKIYRQNESLSAIEGTIHRQGSVMIEQYVPDAFEFAILFYMQEGKAEVKGLSVFETENNVYRGNIVADQIVLRQTVTERVNADVLDTLTEELSKALEKHFTGRYEGPMGVDILVDREGRIHISEINLRYTMGFVALALSRFTVGESRFAIEAGDTTATCRYEAADGRLTAGRLALTPPGGDFTFVLENKSGRLLARTP